MRPLTMRPHGGLIYTSDSSMKRVCLAGVLKLLNSILNFKRGRTYRVAGFPALPRFQLSFHLILQPVALFLLPALRNSFLLVANNSRQLTNVITVSSGSATKLNEYERRSLHIASHSSTPKTVPLKSVLTT